MSILDNLKSALGLSDLGASSHARRTEALERRRRELDEALRVRERELNQQRAAAKQEHAEQVAEAERIVEETRQKCGRTNLATLYAEARPLAEAWVENPTRLTSEALRAVLKRASDVAIEETGEKLLTGALAFVFADLEREKRPGIEHAMAHGFADVRTSPALVQAGKGVRPELAPVDFGEALLTLERALGRVPANPSSCSVYVHRCMELAKIGPSDHDVVKAVEGHEREAEMERQRDFEANNKPLDPTKLPPGSVRGGGYIGRIGW